MSNNFRDVSFALIFGVLIAVVFVSSVVWFYEAGKDRRAKWYELEILRTETCYKEYQYNSRTNLYYLIKSYCGENDE